jgi:phosphoribosylglycinamide formyltransferase-1
LSSTSIIIFASGSGSNAENIVRYFKQRNDVNVCAIFCNNPKAGVIERAELLCIPIELFSRDEWQQEDIMLERLKKYAPNLIVLAGFLWLVPTYLLKAYPQIVNIHPALLPKFGGKGMYGHHVHKAVLAAREKQHGITVHYVNENYDEGKHILQQAFDVTENDNLESISQKISALEMEYFPKAIEQIIAAS